MLQNVSRVSYVFPAIQEEMYRWFNEEKNCDISLNWYNQVGDECVQGENKCHQIVLAMASPLLKQALGEANEGKLCCCADHTSLVDGCIVLADASKEIVNSLLTFIYGKEVPENRALRDEVDTWLKTLQIEHYSHDSSVESEEGQRNEDVDLEDDVLDLEDDVSYTEDSMLAHGGFKCIACQNTTFKNNKVEQYIEHLSDHKTAMLEQLKRSKKEPDATKLYSCEGCQKKVPAGEYGVHIKECFCSIKEEIQRLIKNNTQGENNAINQNTVNQKAIESNQNLKSDVRFSTAAEASTSSASDQNKANQFTCPECNKLFRYKLALKKHTCRQNRSNGSLDVQDSCGVNSSYNNQGEPANTSGADKDKGNKWTFSSSEESNDDDIPQLNTTKPTLNTLGQDRICNLAKDGRNKSSKGRPKGSIPIPRVPIPRELAGGNRMGFDCPECGESCPSKEILRLHDCKIYFGIETENTYRADRQNVELYSRTTQRRSLEESPPVSPNINKKRRKHRSRNRGSRSRSGSKSGDLDNNDNTQNSRMSSSDGEELKPVEKAKTYQKQNVNSYHEKTKIGTQKTSSINHGNREHDRKAIARRADSLEHEMEEPAPTSSLYTNPNGLESSNKRKSISSTPQIIAKNAANIASEASQKLSTDASSQEYSSKTACSSAEGGSNQRLTPQSGAYRKKEEPVSCEQCGRPFSNQNRLTDHILEEHDSDPFG